jgi:hypothetical protein
VPRNSQAIQVRKEGSFLYALERSLYDLPILERYVETENGIEEESSMFLRYLYYVLQQLFAISTMAHFNEEGL